MRSDSKPILWEVDVQRDFMLPGGKLYVPGAEKLLPRIRQLVDLARRGEAFLISSGDQHPVDDPEFARFPPHCVRGSEGARVVPEGLADKICTVPSDPGFRLPAELLDYQQLLIEKQSLDVFENPQTAKIVGRLPSTAEFFLFGVVTEFCVRCAAKGLLELGRRVSLVEDAMQHLEPAAGQAALDELTARGAKLISTAQALRRFSGAAV